ncbi:MULTISPECIES: hypothetical protein [unclassified Streptomyces]|uniref:hypothetical protein n=1 Tax=unclassified Streptomyces TaxID=2593676 RepID=UPI002E2FB4B0|nr:MULTISPECIES: hypothetical protein [unclassified Streptomyces]WUC68993.1 hypothetical protein OG861_32570 [Streptomyces sp. NBC_00539]
MRRTMAGMTACAAAVLLLSGCGSDTSEAPKTPKAPANEGKPAASPTAQPSAPPAKAGGAKHEVTLEVGGTGSTLVMYSGVDSGFEQQTLPWSKTGTVEVSAVERKVGYLVNVVPGTITGPDGKLQQAPCVIKVDGQKVAESDGVTNQKGCSYKIK